MYNRRAEIGILTPQSDAVMTRRNKRTDDGIETPIGRHDRYHYAFLKRQTLIISNIVMRRSRCRHRLTEPRYVQRLLGRQLLNHSVPQRGNPVHPRENARMLGKTFALTEIAARVPERMVDGDVGK